MSSDEEDDNKALALRSDRSLSLTLDDAARIRRNAESQFLAEALPYYARTGSMEYDEPILVYDSRWDSRRDIPSTSTAVQPYNTDQWALEPSSSRMNTGYGGRYGDEGQVSVYGFGGEPSHAQPISWKLSDDDDDDADRRRKTLAEDDDAKRMQMYSHSEEEAYKQKKRGRALEDIGRTSPHKKVKSEEQGDVPAERYRRSCSPSEARPGPSRAADPEVRDEEDARANFRWNIGTEEMGEALKLFEEKLWNRRRIEAKKKADEEVEKACYFGHELLAIDEDYSLRPTALKPGDCRGELHKLGDLTKVFEHAGLTLKKGVKLMLDRVGEFDVNLEDEEVLKKTLNRLACQGHIQKLATLWSGKYYHHVSRDKQGRMLCSLPKDLFPHDHTLNNPLGFRKKQHKFMTRREVEAVLKKHRVFLHVGLPVCEEHNAKLQKLCQETENSFQSVETQGIPSHLYKQIAGLGKSLEVALEEEEAEKSQSQQLDQEPGPSGLADKENMEISNEDEKTVAEKELQPWDAWLENFMDQHKISRWRPKKDYEDLAPDTQRKKVAILRQIVDAAAAGLARDKKDALKADLFRTEMKRQGLLKEGAEMAAVLKHFKEYALAEDPRNFRHELSRLALDVPFEHFQELFPKLHYNTWKRARKDARLHNDGYLEKHLEQLPVRPYNERGMLRFVDFVASPEISQLLPRGVKKTRTSDGQVVELPNVSRSLTEAEIIKAWHDKLVEENALDLWMSTSTYRMLLRACPAQLQKCRPFVDVVEADFNQATRGLDALVKELRNKNFATEMQAETLQRRIREVELYLKVGFRSHCQEISRVPDHCLQHALSDPKDADLAVDCSLGDCAHDHDERCLKCEEIVAVQDDIRRLLEQEQQEKKPARVSREAKQKQAETATWLKEKKQELEKCVSAIEEFKAHQLRAAASEKKRAEIVRNLKEGEALIVNDWAMKATPFAFERTARSWYGQAGNSWHICHVIAKVNGELREHTHVHILSSGEQNSQAVTALMADTIGDLEGVHTVYLRSDNGSPYHSASTIGSLKAIEQKTGKRILSYSFSAAQAGKSNCDRMAAVLKRRVATFVRREKKDVVSPYEFFEAATASPDARATTVKLVKVVEGKRPSSSIPNITKLGYFELDDEGDLRAWQHPQIGCGKKLKKLQPNTSSLDVSKVFSTREFWSPIRSTWKKLTKNESKEVEMEKKVAESVEVNSDVSDEEDDDPYAPSTSLFHCPEPLCVDSFVRQGNLRRHVALGRHHLLQTRQSMHDAAISAYEEKIRTGVTTSEETSGAGDGALGRTTKKPQPAGWALKKPKKSVQVDQKVHAFLQEMFNEWAATGGSRWNPSAAADELRMATNSNGTPRFRPSQLLSAQEIRGMYRKLWTACPVEKAENKKKASKKATEETSGEEEDTEAEEDATEIGVELFNRMDAIASSLTK